MIARAHSFDAVQGARPDYLMEPSEGEDVFEPRCNRTLASEGLRGVVRGDVLRLLGAGAPEWSAVSARSPRQRRNRLAKLLGRSDDRPK